MKDIRFWQRKLVSEGGHNIERKICLFCNGVFNEQHFYCCNKKAIIETKFTHVCKGPNKDLKKYLAKMGIEYETKSKPMEDHGKS